MQSLLDQQIKEEYWQNGYVAIRNLFPKDEVINIIEECDRLASQPDLFSQEMPEAVTRQDISGKLSRDRIDPVIHLSPLFEKISKDKSLKDLLEKIFDDEAVLFKAKLIFKPAGTKGYGLHQDYAYWKQTGIPADAILSVQIAVDSADTENGALIVYPGLHKSTLPSPEDSPRDVDPSVVKGAIQEVMETSPGDILIFHSLTPHLSGANLSQGPRRTLYLTYNAKSYGDFYRSYYGDRLIAT
jgi:ectoine hydroxylase-related dioxygenase (phytanoyl-CoA dioxygenase family)